MDDSRVLGAFPKMKAEARWQGRWLLPPISYLISISKGHTEAANCDYAAKCISKI